MNRIDSYSYSSNIILNLKQFELIPEQCFRYFPFEDEIILFNFKNPKKIKRKIFGGGLEYSTYENDKISEIQFLFQNRQIHFPINFDKTEILRFLQAKNFNILDTFNSLTKHLEWRRLNLPILINHKISEILNSGSIYIHGRDHRFRPNVIINVERIIENKNNFDNNDWNRSIIFLTQFIIEYLLFPGKVENINIICDCKGFNLYKIPTEFKRFLILIQNNYPNRLNNIFLLNVGTIANIVWKMTKGILNEEIKNKVKIFKNNKYYLELFKIIHPDQIEIKFGGNSKDLNRDFFPPKIISNNYLLNEEDPDKILIPIEQLKSLLSEEEKDIVAEVDLLQEEKELREIKIQDNLGLIEDNNYLEKEISNNIEQYNNEENEISVIENNFDNYNNIEIIDNTVTQISENPLTLNKTNPILTENNKSDENNKNNKNDEMLLENNINLIQENKINLNKQNEIEFEEASTQTNQLSCTGMIFNSCLLF